MIKKLIDNKLKLTLALLLVGLAIWSRFVPHPANFTALTAVALFGGAILPKKMSILVPLVAMVVSDLLIGVSSVSLVVWASFALMILVGNYIRDRITLKNVVLASLVGSTIFFVVTNFAVWAEGRMYTMDLPGLIQCYVNALPFFRNMLVGDLMYTGILFGSYAFVLNLAEEKLAFASQASRN